MFDDGIAEELNTREQLLYELKELGQILDESRECAEGFSPEPAWNEAVHYPILRLALKSIAGVKCKNVYGRRLSLILVQRLILSSTTARVVRSLVPRHVSGDILKMVDYTINLQPTDEMRQMILRLLESQPYHLQTINQTMSNHVRYLPIAISIATQTLDAPEQEAKVQLGMWVAAHFNRLRLLSDQTVLPTLPLLYVSGKWWYLLFACDCPQRIVWTFSMSWSPASHIWQELLGELLIGDTKSVVGCYKLLAALRCLAEWVTTTFREWLEVNVLQPNAVLIVRKER